jgi:hypothetical protein
MWRRGLPALGLAVLAALAAAVVVLLAALALDDDPTEKPRAEAPSEIEAQASSAPRPVLFGDTVRATIDVMLDAQRVDPGSVRVAADFSPWDVVGSPDRRIATTDDQAHVRATFVLRCLTGACVPAGQSALYEFPQARVSFTRRGDRFDESSIPVSLPAVRVYSRLTDAVPAEGGPAVPWQADLLSLPVPSFRVAPSIFVLLLLLGAFAATAGAVALAYAAWPRAAPAPLPAPVPLPPPGPVLSPLEQALVLLENAVRVDGAADQRRALELVAEELERADWGNPKLARAARALAWSEDVPPVQVTSELAARVRSVLDETYETHRNGDSDAS